MTRWQDLTAGDVVAEFRRWPRGEKWAFAGGVGLAVVVTFLLCVSVF